MKQIDIIMFATPNLGVYTDLSIPVWKKYCETYHYRFFHYDKPYYEDRHLAWSKIRSVQEHLNTTDSSYVLLVDADTIPTSFEQSVETLLQQYMKGEKQILFQKDGAGLSEGLYFPHNLKNAWLHKKIVMPNAGFILIKKTAETQAFFKEWMDRSDTSPWANRPPRNQNVLIHEMLVQEKINRIVDYVGISVVNRYQGSLCQHFSSASREVVRKKMAPFYVKLMQPKVNVLILFKDKKNMEDTLISHLLSSHYVKEVWIANFSKDTFNHSDKRVKVLPYQGQKALSTLDVLQKAAKIQEEFVLILQENTSIKQHKVIEKLVEQSLATPTGWLNISHKKNQSLIDNNVLGTAIEDVMLAPAFFND